MIIKYNKTNFTSLFAVLCDSFIVCGKHHPVDAAFLCFGYFAGLLDPQDSFIQSHCNECPCLTRSYPKRTCVKSIGHSQSKALSIFKMNKMTRSQCIVYVNTLRPRQNGRHFADDIFKWMKMFEFQLKFHWSLFLRVRLTIFQHWFR